MTTLDTPSAAAPGELRIEPPDLLVLSRQPLGDDGKEQYRAALQRVVEERAIWDQSIGVIDDGAEAIAAVIGRLFPPGATVTLDGIGQVPIVVGEREPRVYPADWVEAAARAEAEYDADSWDDPSSGAAKAEQFRDSYRESARAILAALDRIGALVPADGERS